MWSRRFNIKGWLITILLSYLCGISDGVSISESDHSYDFLLELFDSSDYGSANVTNKCIQDINLITSGLTKRAVWAIKLADASAQPGPGFVWGNNYWMGSQLSCNLLKSPVYVELSKHVHQINMDNLTEIIPPIPIEYRILYARHKSQMQFDVDMMDKSIIHIGLCMPSSCDSSDAFKMFSNKLRDPKFSMKYFHSDNTNMFATKTLKLRDDFFKHPVVIIFLAIVSFNIIMVTGGTIFKAIENKLRINNKLNSNYNNNNNVEIGKDGKRPTKNLLEKIILMFNIQDNSSIITTRKISGDSIEVIHGIRAFSLVWIIVGHIFFYAPGAIENIQHIFVYANSYLLQPLFAVALAVDTFYVISGLVLSYIFFQNSRKGVKERAIIQFLKSFTNRYLRLTPPYLVAMLLTFVISMIVNDFSPYWQTDDNEINCSKYWWQNLIYINNLYPMHGMCMNWSWYLATDFQCFIIATVLLILYTRKPQLALAIGGMIMIAAVSLNAYLGVAMEYSLSLDSLYNTMDYLYTPIYTRITVYFIGVYAGWYLSHHQRKMTLSKMFIRIGWVTMPCLNLFMIFVHVNKQLSPLNGALYTSLGRIVWGLGIAWTIIACSTGHGGIISRVLNSKVLLPMSRLSYSGYLVNPICILFFVMLTDQPMHLDFTSLLVNALGFVVIVFSVAYVFVLFFENPYVRITKLLTKR